MIYLDYSATTKPDKKVIERFSYISSEYFANANSTHTLGISSKKIIDDAISNIAQYLNVEKEEIIFTSGSTESNNTIIKGICDKYEKGHIISSSLEHASVLSPLSYEQRRGFTIDFAPLDDEGKVDVDLLEKLIKDDTVLITISSVNSETGIKNPIDKIGKMIKKYPQVTFHSDMTQSLGKENIDLTYVDAASFSAHKIYGLVGIGLLIVKKGIKFTPLILGGKSITNYRSGTPQTALIDSISTAMDQIIPNLESNITYVTMLNNKIRTHISKYENIIINSPIDALPHILNISFINTTSSNIQKILEDKDIYISTQTACASSYDYSKTILSLTNDLKRASSSIRISLSHNTLLEEINYLLNTIDSIMEEK
ncbi:MAG: cysteine desulfurase family protein [Bacilli bacterium]